MLLADSLVFGLRMNAGVDYTALQRRFPQAGELQHLERLFARLIDEQILIQSQGRLQLTRNGRLLADAVGSSILEQMDALS